MKGITATPCTACPSAIPDRWFAKCNKCGATDGPLYRKPEQAEQWKCPHCVRAAREAAKAAIKAEEKAESVKRGKELQITYKERIDANISRSKPRSHISTITRHR